MNHAAASRDVLLDAAERIVSDEGFEALSIRRLAAECGVAVGTVYNYFASKSDLVVAVIEHFWRSMLHGAVCAPPPHQRFTDYLAALYATLFERVRRFREGLLLRMASLSDEQRAMGLTLERRYYAHMEEGLLLALSQDEEIDPAVFSEGFSQKALCEHALMTMLTRLKAGRRECDFLLQVLERILYPKQPNQKGD